MLLYKAIMVIYCMIIWCSKVKKTQKMKNEKTKRILTINMDTSSVILFELLRFPPEHDLSGHQTLSLQHNLTLDTTTYSPRAEPLVALQHVDLTVVSTACAFGRIFVNVVVVVGVNRWYQLLLLLIKEYRWCSLELSTATAWRRRYQ